MRRRRLRKSANISRDNRPRSDTEMASRVSSVSEAGNLHVSHERKHEKQDLERTPSTELTDDELDAEEGRVKSEKTGAHEGAVTVTQSQKSE